MKKTTLLTISAVLAMTVIASNGFSWTHEKNKYRHHENYVHQGEYTNNNCPQNQDRYSCTDKGFHSRCDQDLSQSQKDQLKALHGQFIDETAEMRASMTDIYEQMRMEMDTSNPDREKLVSLVKRLEPLRVEMLTKRIDFQLEAKKIAPDFAPGFFMGRGHGCGKHRHGRTDCPGWKHNSPGSLDHFSQE